MHFLELARFLNTLHLAGHKVKGSIMPHCRSFHPAVGVWALKPLFSHLHKNTNVPVFYMALGPYDFDEGQRHYLGHWKGNGPHNVFVPHQNHNVPHHIINRFINSYKERSLN